MDEVGDPSLPICVLVMFFNRVSKAPVLRRNKATDSIKYFNRSIFSCNGNPCIR